MPKKRIKKVIEFIKNFLEGRGIAINKIVLFGSYANSSFQQNSDVDIAIVSRDFERKNIFQRAQMLKGLDWALVGRFMLPFDIVPLSLKEWDQSDSLIAEFAHQGQELYS